MANQGALSVTSGASVAVPPGAKDVQNVGPGRIAIGGDSGVTFATGLVIEVNGVYTPASHDAYPDLYLIAESATSSARYLI